MLRWVVNVNLWKPSVVEFDHVLQYLPQQEQEDCLAFKFNIDQRRALVSRLLQRKAASHVLRVPLHEVDIRRTKGNKPFALHTIPQVKGTPNFNFNVAHEGHYVVLASEPVCLCGVDVSAPQEVRRTNGKERRTDIMKRVCTENEVKCMEETARTDSDLQSLFQRHWALKEAFVKARGDGVAFGLKNAEFYFGMDLWNLQAQLKLDGILQTKWCFHLHELDNSHWVAVAKGPPDSCKDEHGLLKSTFHRMHLTDEELQMELQKTEPQFEEKTIPDLIS